MPYVATTIIKKGISVTEEAGFTVLGLTTDQGSNFEKTFRELGVTVQNSKFSVGEKSYWVYRDPPHLLKNARNLLSNEKHPIALPGERGIPSWQHIKHSC